MATLALPDYHVLVDTNALYSRAPSDLVSPGFDAALAKVRTLTGISLLVPEIVRLELVARRVRLALKSRESLVKARKNLEACTGLQIQEPPSETVIRKKILALFDAWLGKSGGSLLQVPEGKGIWSRIINDALWRNPPFESAADDEEKSSEKGFRDALICETVVAYAGQERPE